MAVDDSASAAPMATAVRGCSPKAMPAPAMSAVQSDDLQRAQAEHHPAHQPQPLPRQLQPDHEQQEDDAELGEAGDLLGAA